MWHRVGIMQGRLAPPLDGRIQAFPPDNWRDEFSLSQALGFGCLEWVFEKPNQNKNPLFHGEALPELVAIQKQSGVHIRSVVADYFMEELLFGPDKEAIQAALSVLDLLLRHSAQVGIGIVELPFVDASALNSRQDREQVMENLAGPLARAEDLGLIISLETSLEPELFFDLIQGSGRKNLKINFDMGNSASLGFDPAHEIALLSSHIVNVHIKDRLRGGGTVPLGQGDTDFVAVFKALHESGYDGDYIIQAARQDLAGGGCSPKETIESYRDFIQPFLSGD